MIDKSTPQVINILKQNEVLVFGSCLDGQHRFGEAKAALQFGAEINKSFGLVGQTYAIPIRHRDYKTLLAINEVEKHIDNLLKFARRKHELIFYITAVGCEQKEHGHRIMAQLFKDFLELENVYLPIQWLKILNEKQS
jgi:hypothetical protein